MIFKKKIGECFYMLKVEKDFLTKIQTLKPYNERVIRFEILTWYKSV